MAQSRAELERLQATTFALIESLVESGVLSRAKADTLIINAHAKAEAQLLAQPSLDAPPAEPELGKDGKRVIRVPYVPESLKKEMRDQIKQEVLAQARNERWGEPGALPSWLGRIRFEGDLRLREELIRLVPSNTPPGPGGSNYFIGDLTRAPDIAQSTSNGLSNFNTQESYNRLRLRARLGATGSITEAVSATVRLATGNPAPSTTRTSNNQTLGQYFNNYSAVIDQAYVTVRPAGKSLSLTGGRMPNPYFSTDLVWADDLAFEGLAATGYREFGPNRTAFVTAGYFPLSESRPGVSRSRSLTGLQAGLEMKLGQSANRFKLGVGVYDFRGVEGSKEQLAALTTDPLYGSRYEYAAGFRQRGNTLFNVRAAGDPGTAIYGLASGFRELNVVATLDLPDVVSVPLRLTGDYVKNLKYSRTEMQNRTGVAISDGRDYGLMARAQIGKSQIEKQGDWNASLAYRFLGSDAVLDAFTNTDFGLGGTNSKGFIFGFNYGIYDNTSLGLRWMSANPIDSFAPKSAVPTKLSVDTVHIDLMTRF